MVTLSRAGKPSIVQREPGLNADPRSLLALVKAEIEGEEASELAAGDNGARTVDGADNAHGWLLRCTVWRP